MIESEKVIEKHLVKTVKALGGIAIKMVTSQQSGLPDRLVLLPSGVVLFIEVKTTGEKTRKLQDLMIYKLRKLGLNVYVADTKAEIDKILDKWK